MKYCPKHPLDQILMSPLDKYCFICGTKLEEKQENKCFSCGKTVYKVHKFCVNCGVKL